MAFRDRSPGPRTEPTGGDDALMARIASGDEKALRIFALRHAPKCLAIARRITGSMADAEETVQDALLRVWQHAPSWRRTDARVTTWLYRIVVNLAVDCVRKRRQRFVPLEAVGELRDPAPDAEARLIVWQIEAFVAAVIAALPARQRMALTLCYFEAMECAQAAEVMNVSVSAMESLLVRGRRALHARLTAQGLLPARRPPEAAGPSPAPAAPVALPGPALAASTA